MFLTKLDPLLWRSHRLLWPGAGDRMGLSKRSPSEEQAQLLPLGDRLGLSRKAHLPEPSAT